MKDLKNVCDVKSCFLCKQCLPDWLPAVAAKRKNLMFKKGQQVFKEGDEVKGIYFIYEGSVKVHKRWDEEKELILRFAKNGDILGHLGLGDESVYPISATALSQVMICYLPMDFFEATLNINTRFTYKLMQFFANELQNSERRMRNLVHMPVKARIAQALITLKNQFGTDERGMINIELTRQDMASFAGAAYETLFKVTTEFVNNKIIELKGKSVLIIDEPALLKVIEGDRVS